jgi:hypothetical protein
MLMVAGAATAQAPAVLRSAVLITEMPPVPLAPRSRTPDPVLERLMSFDGNADHRISRNELPERMQELVARGDGNADAALDSKEIRDLVNARSSGRPRVSFRSEPPEGLAGVIKDLKLTPVKHADALTIVTTHELFRNFDGPTVRNLNVKMRSLLDDEEYENFVAAAARLSRSRSPQVIK